MDTSLVSRRLSDDRRENTAIADVVPTTLGLADPVDTRNRGTLRVVLAGGRTTTKESTCLRPGLKERR